jgi:hypothetical protein
LLAVKGGGTQFRRQDRPFGTIQCIVIPFWYGSYQAKGVWLEEKLVDTLIFCWQIDECLLSSLVLGLVRQCSYSFLEYLEESAITAIKIVIKVSDWGVPVQGILCRYGNILNSKVPSNAHNSTPFLGNFFKILFLAASIKNFWRCV